LGMRTAWSRPALNNLTRLRPCIPYLHVPVKRARDAAANPGTHRRTPTQVKQTRTLCGLSNVFACNLAE